MYNKEQYPALDKEAGKRKKKQEKRKETAEKEKDE